MAERVLKIYSCLYIAVFYYSWSCRKTKYASDQYQYSFNIHLNIFTYTRIYRSVIKILKHT
jgi:hypothetical protein